jgi:hypothetical protein
MKSIEVGSIVTISKIFGFHGEIFYYPADYDAIVDEIGKEEFEPYLDEIFDFIFNNPLKTRSNLTNTSFYLTTMTEETEKTELSYIIDDFLSSVCFDDKELELYEPNNFKKIKLILTKGE